MTFKFATEPSNTPVAWVSIQPFGIVHPARCAICTEYLAHVCGSRHQQSFYDALKERNTETGFQFLDGISLGRLLSEEDPRLLAKMDRYRTERDQAEKDAQCIVEELSAALNELRNVRKQLYDVEATLHDILESRTMDTSLVDEENVSADDDSSIDEVGTSNASSIHDEASSSNSSPSRSSEIAPSVTISPDTSVDSLVPPLSTCSYTDAPPLSGRTVPYEDPRDDQPILAPSFEMPFNVNEAQLLMSEARGGRNNEALARVEYLCSQARETPVKQRTDLQRFLLLHWTNAQICPRPTCPRGSEQDEIFVDSSPSFGIGFVIGNKWLAWRLRKEWNSDGRDNNWAELVAVELGLRAAIASGRHSRTIIIRSDNRGVIQALTLRQTKRAVLTGILQQILDLCDAYNVKIVPLFVAGKKNPADAPSRGRFGSSALLFQYSPPVPTHLQGYVYESVELAAILEK